MLTFNMITLFPEFFTSPLQTGLVKKAREKKIIDFTFRNPRDFTENRHRYVDDAPFGGGPGMIIQALPVVKAVGSLDNPGRIISLAPAGKPLTQPLCSQLAEEQAITLICGRYEGIDARINQLLPIEEISVGNVVLNGGETAALMVIEAVSRLVRGFLGKTESANQDSFSAGLLEYDQFTRPASCEGISVPQILLSGNHAQIQAWRRTNGILRTLKKRPDLLASYPMTRQDAETINSCQLTRIGRNISFCLAHYPVKLEGDRIGTSSLTNLDIHDIGRISRSYGLAAFYVLTPLEGQLEILRQILRHWQGSTDRARALELVRPVATFAEMEAAAFELHGCRPKYIASSAQWPRGRKAPPPLTPEDVRRMSLTGPVIIILGTGRGLGDELLAKCDGQLRPIRFINENHLSVRSAAAIIADRILGDFN